MSSRIEAAGVGILVALQLCSCSAKRSPYDLSLRKDDRGKRLSMDEVAGYPEADAPKVTKKGRRAKKTALTAGNVVDVAPVPAARSPAALAAGNVVDVAPMVARTGGNGAQMPAARPLALDLAPALIAGAPACKDLVATVVAPFQRLYAVLPAGSYAPSSSNLDRMLAVTAADCGDKAKRRAALAALAAGAGEHSGKVGIILPLTGPRAKYANYVVQGIRAALEESHLKMEDTVVLKDSVGQAREAEARLAELVFKDKVALVVGGMDKAEADVLAAWAKDLALPVMLLARDREVTAASPNAFRVYPDEKRLAETLVDAAVKRGLKRIAVVRPDNHKSDKIADYFRQALQKGGGNVAFDLVYTPGNLDSMMGVGRQLFQIDAADRREEFQHAYRKAKERSAEEGVPFDARMVVLKPIVQFDAVFLPDDFRTVRHFAKLFKFNMVDKLTMIGNHEWRSEALVSPWDPFLEGSIFADFIGSYTALPAGLAAETIGSPYFVRPQQVVVTDFNLIGYRVGKAAQLLVAGAGKDRRMLAQSALGLTSDQPNFFGNGKVFDAERQSNWPTYVFSVAKERIVLEQTGAGGGVAGAAVSAGKY